MMLAAVFLSVIGSAMILRPIGALLPLVPLHRHTKGGSSLHSFSGRAAFLGDKDDIYTSTIKRRSIEATKQAFDDDLRLVEIEFPPSRVNDPTSAFTFDCTVEFTREYIEDEMWAESDPLYVVFPEMSEKEIALKRWSNNAWKAPSSATFTDLDSLLSGELPRGPCVLLIVAPGFNIEEYEKVSRLESADSKILIINGYISRLRAGFYPGIFYPTLARVTKSFYSRFEQIFHVSPIAVMGERLGAYKIRQYPNGWEILLQNNEASRYDVIDSSSAEPDAKKSWKMATTKYKERTGRMF